MVVLDCVHVTLLNSIFGLDFLIIGRPLRLWPSSIDGAIETALIAHGSLAYVIIVETRLRSVAVMVNGCQHVCVCLSWNHFTNTFAAHGAVQDHLVFASVLQIVSAVGKRNV